MANYGGQRIISVEDMGALALSDEVNAVVGTSATKITKPTGALKAKALVLMSDKGGFRVRRGDFVSSGMPTVEYPTVSVTDGTGGLYIPSGGFVILPAPDQVTVKGYAADSVLTYYWL